MYLIFELRALVAYHDIKDIEETPETDEIPFPEAESNSQSRSKDNRSLPLAQSDLISSYLESDVSNTEVEVETLLDRIVPEPVKIDTVPIELASKKKSLEFAKDFEPSQTFLKNIAPLTKNQKTQSPEDYNHKTSREGSIDLLEETPEPVDLTKEPTPEGTINLTKENPNYLTKEPTPEVFLDWKLGDTSSC